jgi:acetyl esterase/lipase
MRRIFSLSIVILFTVLSGACTGQAEPPQNTVVPTQPTVVPQRDIVYCSPEGQEQKLDLYFPENKSSLNPLAVYIHGGGWSNGDKSLFWGMSIQPTLLKHGYIVASVNYRLYPQAQFPAMIEDVKCAIRFLRANADEYGIDPSRVGVWGDSAGGHLVSLVGAAGPEAGFDVGEYLDQSSAVQAVVDLYGPIDIAGLARKGYLGDLPGTVFGAKNSQDPILEKASPLTYLSADMPPILILHGDHDTTVSMQESQNFYNQLTTEGAEAELVIVKNGIHDLDANPLKIQPTRAELIEKVVAFFDRSLIKR